MAPERRQYLEVICRTTQTINRFARGTTAGDALAIMNRKLKSQFGLNILHVEAVNKCSEEPPIVFGPDSVLEDYSYVWQLETFTDRDMIYGGGHFVKAPNQEILKKLEEPGKKLARIFGGRNDQVSEKPEGTCIQESQAGGGNVDSAAEGSQAGVNN